MSTFVTLTLILSLFIISTASFKWFVYLTKSSGFPNTTDAPGTNLTLLFESVVTYGQ